ncbi:MAG: peptidase dipeptidase [Patescibacteria group bacterium]|nr:peptidase dipeptidase [Patescibacteria group bacterium]
MKLLLTSAGFTTPEITDACVALCGKPRADIAVAVINEAYAVEEGDKRWVLDDLNRIARDFPGKLDIVGLLALTTGQQTARLADADVIFVAGGHTDYLMHVFQKTGFDRLLPELLKTKVYVGSSAGGMVAAQRIPTQAYQDIYGEEGDYGTTRYLGLTDFAIKPHLNSPIFPRNRRETLLKISSGYAKQIYGLQDHQAIMINDNELSFIGGQPLSMLNGKEEKP